MLLVEDAVTTLQEEMTLDLIHHQAKTNSLELV